MTNLKELYPLQPDVVHHFGGGVYAKETIIPKGMRLMQHKHAHDHLSLLASGTVIVKTENGEETHTGPKCLTIAAGKHHEVTALTDSIWYCIHATDCTDPEKVDEVIIGD